MKSPQFLTLVVLACVCIPLSFFLDASINQWMTSTSIPWLTLLSYLISADMVLLGLFVALPVFWLLVTQKKAQAIIVGVTALVAMTSTVLLKMIVQRARPTVVDSSYFDALSYSFPSFHALLCFAMLPSLVLFFPHLRLFYIVSAVAISLSRLFLNVHYVSDVVAGVFVGTLIGLLFLHPHLRLLVTHNTFFELNRKISHIALGIMLMVIVYFDLFSLHWLLLILVVGLFISYLCKNHHIPLFSHLLDMLERKEHRTSFPGKGLFYFLLGTYAVFIFYGDKSIILASLAILTFGDSLSCLYGIHFGSTKHPLDSRKFIEGAFVGFLVGFFAASLFVPPLHAFVAAFLAMVAEGVEVKRGEFFFDDNFLILLVSSTTLFLLQVFL